jgi:hypothetical protein
VASTQSLELLAESGISLYQRFKDHKSYTLRVDVLRVSESTYNPTAISAVYLHLPTWRTGLAAGSAAFAAPSAKRLHEAEMSTSLGNWA